MGCESADDPGPVINEADLSPVQRYMNTYLDNKGFVSRATADELEGGFDTDTGSLTLRVKPESVFSEGDSLTIAGASAISAARAIFSEHPEVQVLDFIMLGSFTAPTGQSSEERAVAVQIGRTTAGTFDFDGLKNLASLDNKNIFCVSDHYEIHAAIYLALKDPGCLAQWGPHK